MAIVTTYRNGCPSWVDVAVPDMAAATRFYTALFGWEAEDQGEEAGHYTMLRLKGKAVGGMGPRRGDAGPPLWGVYLTVDDLAAVSAAIEPAGGSIVMPAMEVMEAGSMLVALDATGSMFHLWQPNQHIGSEIVNEPGAFVWAELATRDLEASQAFYSAIVGWEFQAMDDGAPGGYTLISCNGRTVGGLMPMVGEDWGDLPSHWMAYFGVMDTDQAAAAAADLGGSVPVPPFDTPAGRIAVLNDPGGNAFSVITMAGADEIPDGIA